MYFVYCVLGCVARNLYVLCYCEQSKAKVRQTTLTGVQHTKTAVS